VEAYELMKESGF